MKIYRYTLLLCIVWYGLAFSATAQNQLFKNGDKVCFLGNSITTQGYFHHFITLYYATRYPNEKVSIFNKGIPGDKGINVLNRLDNDVLFYKPTVTVLMLGMNDVNRDLYAKSKLNDPEAIKGRNDALETYYKHTDSIVRRLLSINSRVILLKPSIYDQTAKISAENMFGVNDALLKCGEFMKGLARKYDIGIVDFQGLMLAINKRYQAKDSTFTIVGADRIHPEQAGHLVMAYQFLKENNASKYVSNIVINQDDAKSNTQSANCKISSLVISSQKITFELLENSLPFPVEKEAEPALEWIPFMLDLNQELLAVKNLNNGNYQLMIDNVLIGNYSNKDLATGINLAAIKITPQYLQAVKVLNATKKLQILQGLMRRVKYVEYEYLKGLDTKIDMQKVEPYLSKILARYKNATNVPATRYDYLNTIFTNYVKYKPIESDQYQLELKLQDSIYMVNKPVPHKVTIESVQ